MSGPLTAPQDADLGKDLGTPGPRESRASQNHQSPRHSPWALRKRVKGLEPSTFTLATRRRKQESRGKSADSESTYRAAYLAGAANLVQMLADPASLARLVELLTGGPSHSGDPSA